MTPGWTVPRSRRTADSKVEVSTFSRQAVAALQHMRKRTSDMLADANAHPSPRAGLLKRQMAGLSSAIRLAGRWIRSRRNARLRDGVAWLVLFSPSRTTRLAGETDHAFLSRITRSNRAEPLPHLLGAGPEADLLCLEVRPGLDTATPSNSVLDYVLAQFGILDGIRLLLGALASGSDLGAVIAAAVIDRLRETQSRHGTHLIMLTSNSMLAELIRLAACQTANGGSTEVLHGIASVGMAPYYDFIEEHSGGTLRYVNLISGLVHFPSIQRHLLRDAGGEVAVNCHIWSRIGSDATLRLSRGLVAQQPLVIVGGTSSANDYFGTHFFEGEYRLMEMARRQVPGRATVYCPHPANKVTDGLVRRLADQGVTVSTLPTFSMLFCAGAVVGTYSTSLFEAALLGKRVFLLPFDHSMLMPELIEGVDFGRSIETLESDFLRFAATLGDTLESGIIDKTVALCAERLGLILKVE